MSARTIVIACLSAVAVLFAGYLLLGGSSAGSGSKNGSSQQPPGFTIPSKPISLAPVLAEVRAELQKAGNFFELPALMKVPIPQPAPAGNADPPVTYVWVPPGEQMYMNWEGGSYQYTERNFLKAGGQIVGADLDRPASPRGETIVIEGHYPSPAELVRRASPTVDIAVQPNRNTIVFATTTGKKNATGKWEPVAVPSGGFWLWGKLPDQSVNWHCTVTLTDPTGKPVTSKREPVFVCKAVTGGKIKEEDRHPLQWEKHFPPLDPENPTGSSDKSMMLFAAKDVPAGFNYLVVQTKAKGGQRIYVALVLQK